MYLLLVGTKLPIRIWDAKIWTQRYICSKLLTCILADLKDWLSRIWRCSCYPVKKKSGSLTGVYSVYTPTLSCSSITKEPDWERLRSELHRAVDSWPSVFFPPFLKICDRRSIIIMKTSDLAGKRGDNRCLNNMHRSSTRASDRDEDLFRKTNIYVPTVISDMVNNYSFIPAYKLHPHVEIKTQCKENTLRGCRRCHGDVLNVSLYTRVVRSTVSEKAL